MSYITTITGKYIDFVNITPDQFYIKDIAAGLSNTCRFTGQLENFYSVLNTLCMSARLYRLNMYSKPCYTMRPSRTWVTSLRH